MATVEIVHIDHTELDIEAVCSRRGRVLGRPWLTLLTDAFSPRVLALYLTFDPPSYCSCMMVWREWFRRHARLPQIVVVNGGRDFQSIYFETLLAGMSARSRGTLLRSGCFMSKNSLTTRPPML
jgi:hypothetical protein